MVLGDKVGGGRRRLTGGWGTQFSDVLRNRIRLCFAHIKAEEAARKREPV
jgi:hypothetical protein